MSEPRVLTVGELIALLMQFDLSLPVHHAGCGCCWPGAAGALLIEMDADSFVLISQENDDA